LNGVEVFIGGDVDSLAEVGGSLGVIGCLGRRRHTTPSKEPATPWAGQMTAPRKSRTISPRSATHPIESSTLWLESGVSSFRMTPSF